MIYEKHQIIKRIRDLGLKETNFMIVPIRSKANKPNEFDDLLYLITSEKTIKFPCTTNPGTYWLQNLLNPKGTAVLKQGLWKFQFGLHKGTYKCLVQAEPVIVYRDSDKDTIAEEQGVEDKGWFGIHIHRANSSLISKYIGKYSAGCVVVQNPADYNFLMKTCEESGLSIFNVYLLNEW